MMSSKSYVTKPTTFTQKRNMFLSTETEPVLEHTKTYYDYY